MGQRPDPPFSVVILASDDNVSPTPSMMAGQAAATLMVVGNAGLTAVAISGDQTAHNDSSSMPGTVPPPRRGPADGFAVAARRHFCYLLRVSKSPPDLHSIRGLMGCCHLLVDADASVLIDTGLVGEPWLIRRRLRRLGLRPDSIKAILLTHGHLDHAGNLARLKEWTGARVLAHREEQAHVDGRYPYRGVTKWCGRLEAAGRFLFGYRPAAIDEFLSDGQELPYWGGLRVVHLPGHTLGHCGFYSARHDLLFSGDLMASYFFNTHRPPPILNSAPELFPASVEKVRRLNPRWIVPSHYDYLDGALHRRRFARLYGIEWPAPK